MRTMRAMVFERVGAPLRLLDLPIPEPDPGQVLLRVRACGVCRTDLHLHDGEVEVPDPPRVLGHQIVGETEAERRVGVTWLASTCGTCTCCMSGLENLCERARFTGRDVDGGFAEYTLANERFCFDLPDGYHDQQAAPLLCGGVIGYRALSMCGDARRVGIYGFGAAGHIVAQVAIWQGREISAFTRSGDTATQAFARSVGAVWAGGSDESPPRPLDAAIIFAPVGSLVPTALQHLAPGGIVVCAGIHMTPIPSFDYELLWRERVVRSVANVTARDASELLRIAPEVPIATHVTSYRLEDTNQALADLRAGAFEGAAVVIP